MVCNTAVNVYVTVATVCNIDMTECATVVDVANIAVTVCATVFDICNIAMTVRVTVDDACNIDVTICATVAVVCNVDVDLPVTSLLGRCSSSSCSCWAVCWRRPWLGVGSCINATRYAARNTQKRSKPTIRRRTKNSSR